MRLLIVEDDPKLADFVARGLRAERFAVDVASDGLLGEQHLGAYHYDLLVLELMLPRLSGSEQSPSRRDRRAGAHGHTWLREVLLGSVTRDLLSHLRLPAMLSH